MTQEEALKLLRESYQEVLAREKKPVIPAVHEIFSREKRRVNISTLRRYLRYTMDILDIYLDIQRDRRWKREEW